MNRSGKIYLFKKQVGTTDGWFDELTDFTWGLDS